MIDVLLSNGHLTSTETLHDAAVVIALHANTDGGRVTAADVYEALEAAEVAS